MPSSIYSPISSSLRASPTRSTPQPQTPNPKPQTPNLETRRCWVSFANSCSWRALKAAGVHELVTRTRLTNSSQELVTRTRLTNSSRKPGVAFVSMRGRNRRGKMACLCLQRRSLSRERLPLFAIDVEMFVPFHRCGVRVHFCRRRVLFSDAESCVTCVTRRLVLLMLV